MQEACRNLATGHAHSGSALSDKALKCLSEFVAQGQPTLCAIVCVDGNIGPLVRLCKTDPERCAPGQRVFQRQLEIGQEIKALDQERRVKPVTLAALPGGVSHQPQAAWDGDIGAGAQAKRAPIAARVTAHVDPMTCRNSDKRGRTSDNVAGRADLREAGAPGGEPDENRVPQSHSTSRARPSPPSWASTR